MWRFGRIPYALKMYAAIFDRKNTKRCLASCADKLSVTKRAKNVSAPVPGKTLHSSDRATDSERDREKPSNGRRLCHKNQQITL